MKRHLTTVVISAVTSLLCMGAILSLLSARADQSERVPPTGGIYTGVQFSGLLGDSIRSISTGNKGSTAPANVGGSAVNGLEWIDDSTTPWIKKRYVNGGWAVEGALDPTDSSYAGVIGGGLGSISSASTTDLGSVPQANVTITGNTTISGFGSSARPGIVKIIRFAGALSLTYSANLTVPTGGYDLTTAANDRAIVTHLGSGVWEFTQYTRANGVPVDFASVGKPTHDFGETLPPLHAYGNGAAILRASYPAFVARVTRAQNGTRTSGNATIASVGNTKAFGVGMPVEGTGIGTGCTIASFVANTSITLNSSACVTSSGTSTVTVFLTGYGTAGDATTVGVPRCDGAVLAGRETTPSRLTSTYFGNNSSAMAAFGGSESTPMALGNLIAHTHANSLTDPHHAHDTFGLNTARVFGGFGTSGPPVVGVQINNGDDGNMVTDSVATGISINNASAGSVSPTPMRTVMPTVIAECVVRVTP